MTADHDDGADHPGGVALWPGKILLCRVTWADVRPGDVVYYATPWMGGESGRVARGPFRAVDPVARTVANLNGVIFPVGTRAVALVPHGSVTPPAGAGVTPPRS